MVIVGLYFKGLLKTEARKYDYQNEFLELGLNQPKFLCLFGKFHEVFNFHLAH